MPARSLKARHAARREDIADLYTVSPLPGPDLDPFLLLNHHGPQVYQAGNRGLPFGPHPHRGMETVTFILEGDLTHQDNAGHESIIRAGGVQWMTAGSGLIHAEVSSEQFKREGGPLEILQLWINLPARLKLTAPRYKGLQRDQIPVVSVGDARVQAIAGFTPAAPFDSLTGVVMTTVALPAGGSATFPAPADRTVFLYVVRGDVEVAGQPARATQLLELNADGDEVALTASSDAFLLFGHAAPYQEPVAWHGPFVMNTQAEIMQAFADYQAGKFGQPF